MNHEKVRAVLGAQLELLHERSKNDIPLIALDGLSKEAVAIGRLLLNDGGANAQATLREARPVVIELHELAVRKLSPDYETGKALIDGLHQLRELLCGRSTGDA